MTKEFQPCYKWAFKVATQEEADLLKKTALELEYKWSSDFDNDWEKYPYIMNGYRTGGASEIKSYKMIGFQGNDWLSRPNNKYNTIETWNLDLFKAVILASEGEDFIPGEWAKAINEAKDFTQPFRSQYSIGKLYQVKESSKGWINTILDDRGNDKNGWCSDNFVKPSIEELKGYFNQKPKEKLNTMNKQTKINVRGSKNLITAFIEEISSMGWKGPGNSLNAKEITIGCLNKVYSYYPWDHEVVTFNLPQDWNSALEAFKNYDKPQEYAKGDWVTCIEGDSKYVNGVGWELGKTFQVYEISQGSGNRQCLFAKGDNGVYNSHLRPATPEEIEKAQKHKEIIVKCKYSDGLFDVKVKAGTETLISKDNTFQISEIKNLINLMGSVTSQTDVRSPWSISFSYVNIGCKDQIPVESLEDIVSAWKKLNK